jgi:hypothetical protein
MKKMRLDAEEKNILDSYERDEWKPVKNPKAEIKKLSEYAKNTLQKDKDTLNKGGHSDRKP